MSRRARLLVPVLLGLSTIHCATTGRLRLPEGTGVPLSNAAEVLADGTRACAKVESVTGELRISGRAGTQTLRGTVIVGVSRPDALRLEGVAPFGAPAFILVSQNGRAMLLLPRDNRVVTGVPPERIIEALTGVALVPAELPAMLTGCGFGVAEMVEGVAFADRWAAVALSNGSRVYLKQTGSRWRIVAAVRPNLTVEYRDLQGTFPQTVRLLTRVGADHAAAQSDLVIRVAELEAGARLDAATFTVKVPPDAVPLTLDELRRAGPLGGSTSEPDLP